MDYGIDRQADQLIDQQVKKCIEYLSIIIIINIIIIITIIIIIMVIIIIIIIIINWTII